MKNRIFYLRNFFRLYGFVCAALLVSISCQRLFAPNPPQRGVSPADDFAINNQEGQIQINSSGETEILDARGVPVSYCSRARIEGSYELYAYSKKYLANYFRTRSIRELFIAWYFSEDSKFMALSVRNCADKKNMHFYALKTLLRKNGIIQNLITVNMRTREHADLAEIYIDEYYDLFPKDIK